MVGTDRTVETDVIESLHDLVHIERTVSGKVSGFLEVGGRMELQVTNVSEVNSAFERTDHVREIVLEVGAVRTGAEGNAIVRIVNHLHHAKDVLLVDDISGDDSGGKCRRRDGKDIK